MEPIKKLIKQASVQIDRDRERFANSLGITGVQMSVIDFLANCQNPAVDQQVIEHEFGIKRSTTTVMLQRMEKRGLVYRVDDSKDKRKKIVKLTPKSLSLVNEIKKYITNDDLQTRAKLTSEDIIAITKILNLIKAGNVNESN